MLERDVGTCEVSKGGERIHAGEAKEREVMLGSTEWVVAENDVCWRKLGFTGLDGCLLFATCTISSSIDMFPNQ